MKFDYVIGNPPYQDEVADSDNKTFMPPVYNLFMDAAYSVADRVELIHPARFLFNAGQTPKAWNERMLNDPHFKILHYNADASTIFPNTYINGGIVVSYRSSSDEYGAIGVFTSFEQLNGILHKVRVKDGATSLGTIVYNQNRFDLSTLFVEHPEYSGIIGNNGRDKRFRNNIFEKISSFTETAVNPNDIRIIGVYKSKRVWRYIPIRFVDLNHENLNHWKVIISSADGAAGTIGNPIPARVLGEPTVLQPNEGYTQTFIGIGAVETKEEAVAIRNYIKTRFCRTLTAVLKVTQHITPETFKYVPLQDFTPASDIDWSQSIHEIDQQLYRKYGLNDDEISFIETHVKEMT